MLEFIGLEWNERCLSFQDTQRVVVTASSWQVRQKMYTHSVGRSEAYKKFLGASKSAEKLSEPAARGLASAHEGLRTP